ncbi:alkyl/aryl-sulfatase [Anaerolentibacter hominis]|uniref:alkyl/aryl-sulfatase n=1 Tax=Anaerolentibacter hominis TaxID=3079009 RepID=UPI0031B8007B
MKPFTRDPKPATPYTIAKNQEIYNILDFSDQHEQECALKNRLAAPDHLEIKDSSGKVVWSQKAFEFLEDQDREEDTVHPSYRRNAWLNHQYGLFQVVDGIYQVRGYDMSNFTVIRGERGWIVCDPLISCECSAAALNLVNEILGFRPVTGILISHPHIDHFGGIRGIVREEDIASGSIPLIVPQHFTHHAVSENVYAMNAMQRRAGYQYGTYLEPGPKGTLSMGIGMGQSKGLITFIRPTDEITFTGEERTVDGIRFIFQLTPETESPAEMCWYLPDFHAFWAAELCNATLHNLYTLRGTQIRDGNAWACYLMEAKALFGADLSVVFQSHNWPHWGNEEGNQYLENTAAIYKFINDQTLMYMNMGYTPNEISHKIRLPEAMEKVWYTRPYYGTLSHNAKAVYQKYLGWYDANPVNLNPLTPTDRAEKLVEYMGSPKDILEKAYQDFERGEYQWAAEIANALVFYDPQNEPARLLCADALEQLGYQSECGPWRNAYLTAAAELRGGVVSDPSKQASNSGDLAKCMDIPMMLEYLGILIDGEKAQETDLKLNFHISDTGESYYVHLYHGALLYSHGESKDIADADLTLHRAAFSAILFRKKETWPKLIRIKGRQDVLEKLTEHMTAFDRTFPIAEP